MHQPNDRVLNLKELARLEMRVLGACAETYNIWSRYRMAESEISQNIRTSEVISHEANTFDISRVSHAISVFSHDYDRNDMKLISLYLQYITS